MKNTTLNLMTTIILLTIITLFNCINIKQQHHIQNIETKLNIYEQSYNNFVLEDSLKQ